MQNQQIKKLDRALGSRLLLVIFTIIALIAASLLPVSADIAPVPDYTFKSIYITESDLASYSMYSLQFDATSNTLYGEGADGWSDTLYYDCVVISQHSKTNAFTTSRVFLANEGEGTLTLNTYQNRLHINNQVAGYHYEYDLTESLYSIWFVDFGTLTATQHNTNITALQRYYNFYNKPNLLWRIVFDNNYGDADATDRAAQGAFQIRNRLSRIEVNSARNEGRELGQAEGEAAGYSRGFSEGFDDGTQTKETLFSFISAIFTAPSHFINTIFDFDLFGFQVSGIIKVLFTLIVVGFFIKFFIKHGGV